VGLLCPPTTYLALGVVRRFGKPLNKVAMPPMGVLLVDHDDACTDARAIE
jgi:hypothetical protein